SQQPPDLEFLSPAPVRFVPVHFRLKDSSVRQANRTNSFHLPPSTPPVELSEPRQLQNSATARDRLDASELSDDLKVHGPSLPRSAVEPTTSALCRLGLDA